MYELTIEHGFSAAHAITMNGEREGMHGHDWQVQAIVGGTALDADGLLCDFHRLEESLTAIIAPFANACLNDTEPFDRLNPTAEHVARHIAESLATRVPPPAVVQSVSVTEAPGCTATYRMSAS